MTTYAFIILLGLSVGLALMCLTWQPRTLRWAWPAAACLAGALLGLPAVSVVAVTVMVAALTWPVRRAWA